MGQLQLCDLGERRIVTEIVAKHCRGIGDDCAVVPVPESEVVITTDPVPEPAAAVLAHDEDPYWKGWLLAVINASDLAAAGAKPIAFTAAIEAPPNLGADAFDRMLHGVADACQKEEMLYVGGNLREGQRLTGVGTAVGICVPGHALRRVQARAGDSVVIIGQCGRFWRDILAIRGGRPIDEEMRTASPVFRPRSQWRVMNALATERLVSAAIDNSDGLLPSLQQLAVANGLEIVLDISEFSGRGHGDDASVRACFGWGDWNVIAIIAPVNLERAAQIANEYGTSFQAVGECCDQRPGVLLRRDQRVLVAPRLESERFAADSWFTAGIEGYIESLVTLSLP